MFEPINLITLAPKHTLIWIRNVSEEVYTVSHVVYSWLMDFEPHIRKKRLNLASESVCFTFVPAKKNHIVLQADVALAFEGVFYEHIQAIELNGIPSGVPTPVSVNASTGSIFAFTNCLSLNMLSSPERIRLWIMCS